MRLGFDPWVGKMPWSRKWKRTPVFSPGKFHEQKNLGATVHGVAKSLTRLSTNTCESLTRLFQWPLTVLPDSLSLSSDSSLTESPESFS